MTAKMRMTNKRIIKKLLPILKEAIKEKLDWSTAQLDYYKHPSIIYYKDGIEVRHTKYGEKKIITEVIMPLKGKYDHATLSYQTGWDGFGYEKEFTGMGNGFYADVSFDGKIIKSEWD